MRLRGSALKAAAAAVAAYAVVLVLWRASGPVYMGALGVFIEAVDVALPAPARAVLVPAQGLAVLVEGREPFAVPQRIIGADLALTVALMTIAAWLPWRARARRLVLALLLVFAAHVATIVAEAWAAASTSSVLLGVWTLWTTLYQGKAVPIIVWCGVAVPPLFRPSDGAAKFARPG